jgi:PTS system nitrogen regulatory IIA component
MQLDTLISPDRIICNADVASKKRALELISELLCKNSSQLSSQKVFESLVNRERLGSTGVGNGIAIPHARINGIDEAIGAVLKLKTGVDYDAVDNLPVDILFALLVPESHTDQHLQILSTLATLFSNPEACISIRKCDSAEPMLLVLQEWVDKLEQ